MLSPSTPTLPTGKAFGEECNFCNFQPEDDFGLILRSPIPKKKNVSKKMLPFAGMELLLVHSRINYQSVLVAKEFDFLRA